MIETIIGYTKAKENIKKGDLICIVGISMENNPELERDLYAIHDCDDRLFKGTQEELNAKIEELNKD